MKFYTINTLIVALSLGTLNAQIGINTPSSSSAVNTLDVVGSSATPATSGNNANGTLRLQKVSANTALDMGVNGTTYGWIQTRNASDYSVNYPLLLNPIAGKIAIGGGESAQVLTVNGNVFLTGSVQAAQAGQVLNTVILNESDLSKSSTTNVSSGRSTVLSYTYTPLSSSSKIYVSFHGRGYINGAGLDEWYSYLLVGSTTIQTRRAKFENSTGGGGRGTSLVPISGVFTNSATNALVIKLDIERISTDDTYALQNDMILSITEVAR
jgi:hypothetical protein